MQQESHSTEHLILAEHTRHGPEQWSQSCEGDGDVTGVVTPLVRGGVQVLHGDQVVELRVQLEVQEREEKGEEGEGQVEVEDERGELKERRTWMTMGMK